jgi:fibronectin type 3 domain-containing protein
VQVGTTAENVITFADERVDRGRTYVYRVRAFNEAGNSPYSNVSAVTVPEGPAVPAAPRELNAELTDALKVKITWNDVANETGYKVERRVDGTDAWAQIGTTAANVTNFVDEQVERGKTYVYRVRAFNDVGNSSYSNTDAVRVPGEIQTPLAPRLEVDLVAPRAAKLTWTNVANETGYRIERRVDGSPEAWREIRAVGADVTTITDDGLEPGKTYLYRVRAFNASGNSPYSNTGFVRVLQEGLPTAPRELRATVASPTRVELRWVDASGETGYRIERRVDGTDGWTKISQRAANATTYVDTSVVAGKTYIYRVRAFNDVGNSAWSNSVAVRVGGEGTTTPAAPRLEGALVAPRAAKLSWTNVADEAGYRVERKVDGSGEEYRVIRTVGANVTTVTDDGLDLGKTFLYRVVAFNAAGASPTSNVVGVRTAGEVPPTTRPAAPRELRAVAVSPTQIDLRWVGVEGETGYRIERRVDGTATWEKVTFTAPDVSSFSDKLVRPGITYVYRVRAQGPTEASAWSNTAAAKTPEGPVAVVPSLFSARRIAPLDL